MSGHGDSASCVVRSQKQTGDPDLNLETLEALKLPWQEKQTKESLK
jgi:hypothetical protein